MMILGENSAKDFSPVRKYLFDVPRHEETLNQHAPGYGISNSIPHFRVSAYFVE
jgi:hypothetical protein